MKMSVKINDNFLLARAFDLFSSGNKQITAYIELTTTVGIPGLRQHM